METQTAVIIGGGQAGHYAAASLRDEGFPGGITLLAGEAELPYQRPPLSKQYLKDPAGGDLVLRAESFYASRRIELVLGDAAIGIDRKEQQVELGSGRRIRYHRLVLATGARPRTLGILGAQLDGVLTLRTVADADRLRSLLVAGGRLVVVGAGMIGFEVAAVARQRGLDVTVVEALPAAMARVVSSPLADYLTAEQRRRGVRILFGEQVSALRGDAAGRVCGVDLSSGQYRDADVVVMAVGVQPNTELATEAGLDAEDGVLVDEQLRTSDPAIFAIGDCARYPSRHAGRLVRLESVQNAVDQGRHVGAVVCGKPRPYAAVPWFWTDQHDIKVQIAGLTQGYDRTVIAGRPEDGRFSVFCFRESRLLGVESVNRPADHIKARRLMAAGDPGVAPEDICDDSFPPGRALTARVTQ